MRARRPAARARRAAPRTEARVGKVKMARWPIFEIAATGYSGGGYGDGGARGGGGGGRALFLHRGQRVESDRGDAGAPRFNRKLYHTTNRKILTRGDSRSAPAANTPTHEAACFCDHVRRARLCRACARARGTTCAHQGNAGEEKRAAHASANPSPPAPRGAPC